jgi:hypothetical protein
MVREKAGASTRSDESRHPEIPAAAEKAPERTARVAKLMAKRSNFLRRANDDYPTPAKAVCPLLPHVKEGRTFNQPCAGTGQLTKHLAEAGLIPLRSYDISQGYDARVIEYPHDAEFLHYESSLDPAIASPNHCESEAAEADVATVRC